MPSPGYWDDINVITANIFFHHSRPRPALGASAAAFDMSPCHNIENVPTIVLDTASRPERSVLKYKSTSVKQLSVSFQPTLSPSIMSSNNSDRSSDNLVLSIAASPPTSSRSESPNSQSDSGLSAEDTPSPTPAHHLPQCSTHTSAFGATRWSAYELWKHPIEDQSSQPQPLRYQTGSFQPGIET